MEQPAGNPGGILRREPAVVDGNSHRADFRQRLASDLIVHEDVPAADANQLAGQADNPFDISLRGLARKVEDSHLPPVRLAKRVDELLDQHAVAAGLDRRTVIKSPFPAVGADGLAGLAFVFDANHENRVAPRARDLAMPPQQRRCHRAGGNDVSLCRESSHEQHAQAKHHDQFDRLAHSAGPRAFEPPVLPHGM